MSGDQGGCPFHTNQKGGQDEVPLPYEPTKLKMTRWFYQQWRVVLTPSVFVDRVVRQYGDFVYYRGVFNFHLINDPLLISQVFKQTHKNFNKRSSLYQRFRHALGDSLVTAEGEHWKKQRKLLSPSFAPSAVKNYFLQMERSCKIFLNDWDGYVKSGGSFDFSREMNRLSLEVAGSVLFSQSFEGNSEQIHKWVKVINRFSARPPIPIIGSPEFPRPLTMKMNRVMREYGEFMHKLIAERRKGEDQGDLLSLILGMHDEETKEKMTEGEVAEEVLGMIIGSHESTAITLTWLFYELAKNPGCQKTLEQEIVEVTNGEQIQFEHLDKLNYLKQVIYETLRLHPPFWLENRNVTQEVKLGEKTLQKGDLVVLSRYAIHHNPKYWTEPELFNPERFDENKINMDELMRSGKYVPFSQGPRVCMGRHFAMTELIIIVVTMLNKYKIGVQAGQSDKVVAKVTMELKHGLKTTITKR